MGLLYRRSFFIYRRDSSAQKIVLLLKNGRRCDRIIIRKVVMRKPLSLYIHIPFCNSKCNYCNFVSFVRNPSTKALYMDYLKKEIALRASELSAKFEIQTIYIGGGTPSCLDAGEIAKLMLAVYSNFTVSNSAEITIEINPNTLTLEKAREYLRAGINRFSIGLQSASPKLLKLMGRTHTYADFEKAVENLRRAGANNISADIMLGLPTQTIADIDDVLKKVITLKISHISAYMLSVEEGTPFARLKAIGELVLPTETETLRQYNRVYKTLEANGYNRYEFSNFAKDGFQSRHNKIYWERKDYLGLGISAHSYVDGVRFANTSDLNLYEDYLAKNNFALESKDKLTETEKKEEAIMLSLRTANGLDLDEYEREFGENFVTTHKSALETLIKGKFLILDDKTLRATDNGFLVLNKIIEMLI